jgi:molybdenum cofactor guanylyltransferase
MQAAGFVLAGGKSSRMGRDKALLPGLFRYVVDDVAESVRGAAGSISLVGDPHRYEQLGYPCIPDLRPGMGPLSGLETALANTQSNLNLVLACDMPAPDVGHLRFLLGRAQESNHDCIATRDSAGKVHPLCAVYKAQSLPVVRRRLDAHQLSLMGALDELATEYVHVPWVVENINTPDDWLRWCSKERVNPPEAWQDCT